MRLPARKLWRAFPEMDKFSDDECRGYVKEAAWRRGDSAFFIVAGGLFLGLVVGLVIVAGAMELRPMLGPATERGPAYVAPAQRVLSVVTIVGFFGSIGMGGLISRDIWLRRALRLRLNLARCGRCKYSLLGLEIQTDRAGDEYVMCPECAEQTSLRGIGATREDFMVRAETPSQLPPQPPPLPTP